MAKSMIENESDLGKSKKGERVKRIVESVARAIGIKKDAKTGPGGRVSSIYRILRTTPREELSVRTQAQHNTKEWSEEVVKGLRQGKLPPEIKLDKTVEVSHEIIHTHQTKIDWLIGKEEVIHSEIAAQVIAEISESGLEDNPDFLLAKGAQLRWSIKSDTSPEEEAEIRKYLKRLREKVTKLYKIEPVVIDEKVQVLPKEQRELFNTIGHNLSGFESGMMPSPGASGAVDGIDIVIPKGGSKEFIKLHTGLYNLSGGKITAYDAVTADRAIADALKNTKVTDPAEVAELHGLRKKIEDLIKKTGKGSERFSTIYLNETEIDQITDNPAWFFELKLREIEAAGSEDTSSILLKGALNRLELAGQFFASGQFDESQIITEVDKTKRDQLIEALRGGGLKRDKKQLLSEYVNRRLDVVFTVSMLSTTDDPKKFGEQMKKLGDRGVNLVRATGHNIVGEWTGRLERNYRELAHIPDSDDITRFMPETLAEAERITVKQLMQEASVWEKQYKEFFLRFMPDSIKVDPIKLAKQEKYLRLIDPPNSGEDRSGEAACNSIIRLSSFVFRLEMRKAQVMATGLSPKSGEGLVNMSSYLTANIEESMNKVYLFRDWFIRKWGGFTPSRIAVWNMGARFYAEMNQDIRKLVQERTDKIWGELRGADIAKKTAAEEYVKFLVKMNEPAHAKELEFLDDDAEFAKFLRKLKFDKLKDYVGIEEGGYRMQNFLKPYSNFDSFWREDTYVQVFKEAYDYGDKLLLGRKIRQAAIKYFSSQKHHRDKEYGNFVNALTETARYRPQALVEFLYLGENEDFKSWFVTNKTPLGNFNRPHELLHAVSRRFLMINGKLMAKGIAPIDYGGFPLTKEQSTIIDEIFGIDLGSGEINSRDEYIKVMSLFGQHLTNDGGKQLKDLTKIQYDRFYNSIAWIDDAPIGYLEDLEELIKFKDDPVRLREELKKRGMREDFKLTEISKRLTELGKGPGSPLGRAWSDFTVATEAFVKLQENSFTPDEKSFMETFQAVWNFIQIYSGNELGASASIAYAASYLGSAKVKDNYGSFLKFLANSSVFKEFFGDHAPSLSLDDIAATKEKLDLFRGKLSLIAPQLAEQLEDYLGISTVNILGYKVSWNKIYHNVPYLDKIIDSKTMSSIEKFLPLGLASFKSKMALVYFGIIVTLFVADQAKKGGEEATKH